MQFKKKILYSGIIAATSLIVSIFIPIVPCRIAPGIPNPIYKWTLCSLNPDKISKMGSITEYFGYTSALRESYLLTLLLTFVVTILILHYVTKKKNKN